MENNNTRNYTEEAQSLITNLVTTIGNDYGAFINWLIESEQYEFYKKQSSYIQRLMFFDNYGNYESYRNTVKQFIFDNPYRWNWNYDEQDAERAKSIDEVFKQKNWVYTYEWGAGAYINEMITFKTKILEENPILTSELPRDVREDLMDSILRNSPNYQHLKKTIDKYINKIVAHIITMQKDNSERTHR